VQIFQDAADEGAPLEKNLEAGVKILDSAELDFSRYADTLFEVLFAGGRLATGGNLADDQKEKLATNVSARMHVCVELCCVVRGERQGVA